MATVRYIVNDVDESIAFYCRHLGFEERMHPAPPFAMLTRDDLRLLIVSPVGADQPGGGSRQLPDGTVQEPGGWNRFALEVADVESVVETLRNDGVRLRTAVITGVGGKQALVEDPSGNLIELFEPIIPEAYEHQTGRSAE
ncbi:MAG TPA: VOC family protein [Kribbella sp.]|nr:VOC family protein [Kribbella sp.]